MSICTSTITAIIIITITMRVPATRYDQEIEIMSVYLQRYRVESKVTFQNGETLDFILVKHVLHFLVLYRR